MAAEHAGQPRLDPVASRRLTTFRRPETGDHVSTPEDGIAVPVAEKQCEFDVESVVVAQQAQNPPAGHAVNSWR